MGIKNILFNLPEVQGPTQKQVPFKTKLIWTFIILVAFFLLGIVPLYGLGQNALAQFEFLSILLGASFGSIISLGIGPMVTGSIVMQLLNGSGIINFDLTSPEGRKTFQGWQKLAVLFFIVLEAFIYVFMGGLAPSAGLPPSTHLFMQLLLVGQLIIGGLLIMLMDEVCQKWGFGSGLSLFIAAGVSTEIVIKAITPLTTAGVWAFGSGQAPVGQLWVLINSLINQNIQGATLALSAFIATIVVFVMSVYGQAMKVEIPLSFGRVRGHGVRWPLNFIYTSNIPVILIAALLANVQLFAQLFQNWGYPLLGTFNGGQPASGLVLWIFPPNLVENIITGAFVPIDLAHALTYLVILTIGAIIFSVFWVQTAGQDSKSVAKQMMASGLQVPGFRRDQRVMESILDRYIFPLTIMGGAAVGILAGTADVLGALSRGTGILLAVMIIYRMYEDIAKKHMADMNPALRKMIEV